MIFKTVTGFGGDNVVECIDIQIDLIANTSILKLKSYENITLLISC